jgi:hypothetical protein
MRGRPKEPGFRKLPVPEKNDLRPFANNPAWRDPARSGLTYAQGVQKVMDIAAPRPGWPDGESSSPASARYTPGLRKTNIEAPKDPQPFTLQQGEKRQ